MSYMPTLEQSYDFFTREWEEEPEEAEVPKKGDEEEEEEEKEEKPEAEEQETVILKACVSDFTASNTFAGFW